MPKDQNVLQQHQKYSFFFGILNGSISINVQKPKKKVKSTNSIDELLKKKKEMNEAKKLHNNLKITEKWKLRKAVHVEENLIVPKENVEEVEKLIYKEGMCFGERGLIYHKDRIVLASTLEDCELFILHKDAFDASISVKIGFKKKCIIKAEIERKTLIVSSFSFLKDIPNIRFEDIYRRFNLKVYY